MGGKDPNVIVIVIDIKNRNRRRVRVRGHEGTILRSVSGSELESVSIVNREVYGTVNGP